MKMYGNWRSAASFRVRSALNLKGIPYEEVFLDIDAGDHQKPDFLAINPQGAVPAVFVDDGPPLTQSLAILDYLEESFPQTPLLPANPKSRARARSLAQLVACDTHPLYTPRVRKHLMQAYGLDKQRALDFLRYAFHQGLTTLEARLSGEPGTGRFAQGDIVSLWVGTAIFGIDTSPYPTVKRVAEACLALEPVARAHPLRQPGAPS